jgi:hypothetical protein
MELKRIEQIFAQHLDAKSVHSQDWELHFLRLTFFTKGIKPNYRLLGLHTNDSSSYNRYSEEADKYEQLVKNEVFTRYPYDYVETYNIRKSLCNTEAIKDLVDRFFIELTSVLFQGSNFDINSDSTKLNDWIFNTNFNEFAKTQIISRIVKDDPNAYFIIGEGHSDEFGKNEEAIPIIQYVPSSDILFISKTMLIHKNGAVSENEIYNHKTKLVHPHKFGELPIVKAGGIFITDYVSESHISSIFSNGAKALQHSTDKEIELKMIATRLEVVEPACMTCNGSGKSINDTTKHCDICNGRGVISLNHGSVVTYPESYDNDNKPSTGRNRFNYTQADVTYLDRLSELEKSEIEKIERKLGLFSLDGNTQRSAEYVKEIKEQRSLIFNHIGRHYYNVVNSILYFVSKYLKQSEELYTINIPTRYDLDTVEDSLAQLKWERENNLPQSVINDTELKYIIKQYGEGSINEKILRLIQTYDPLYGMNENVIMSGYDNESIAIHKYFDHYLRKYIQSVGTGVFMELEMEKIFNDVMINLKPIIERMPII